MKKAFTALLACVAITILSSGCVGTQWTKPALEIPAFEQGHIYVCLDLPDKSLPGAHDAVDQWDHALHQWRHVEAVDHGQPWLTTCNLWVHESKDAPEDNDAYNTPKPLAWTSTLGGFEISMRTGWYEQDVSGILQHEMGHAFGAQHVAGTLMNSRWYPHAFICPDKTTVAQVAAWQQLNLDGLSYCY
jgi:hypothetical protein